MLDFLAPLDLYCERLAPGLLAEPLNALTNLSFFISAGLLLQFQARLGRPDLQARLLAWLIAAIGAGSLAFHTAANVVTSFLDVGFIGIFILGFLLCFIPRAYNTTRKMAMLGIAAFLALVLALSAVQLPVPGVYSASWLMLAGFALHMSLREHASADAMRKAAGIFTLALTFRTLDLPLCDSVPSGTHFLWHALNGAVLYFVVHAVMVSTKRS